MTASIQSTRPSKGAFSIVWHSCVAAATRHCAGCMLAIMLWAVVAAVVGCSGSSSKSDSASSPDSSSLSSTVCHFIGSTDAGADGTSVKIVTAGQDHSCALTTTGSVCCWGGNKNGQLGNGTNANSLVPVAVRGISTATSIAAGSYHTCATLADGSLQCWGKADSLIEYGKDSNMPITIAGISAVTSVVSGGLDNCVAGGGAVQCWPEYWVVQGVPQPATVLSSGASSVAIGDHHVCAVVNDEQIVCQGENGNGQLGDGSTTDSSSFVTVTGLSPSTTGKVTSVVVGTAHSCALFEDSHIECWGNYAQAGGISGTQTTPYPINGPNGNEKLLAISAYGFNTCGIHLDGTAWCMGTITNSSYPSALRDGVTIAVGAGHACAVLKNGSVQCWGRNESGELGDGTTNASSEPVTVGG